MTAIEVHYPKIATFINKRVNNKSDAEDLTQEVFYKMVRSQQNGKAIENPQKWLYSIARNTIIDYYRKRKIVIQNLDNIETKITKNDITLSISEEQKKSLKSYLLHLISELGEEEQKIITMAEIQAMSQKEIAIELGLNYTTVRSKVQRARAKLKKKITDCCQVIQGGKGSIIDYKKKPQTACNTTCDNDLNCQ